MYVIFYLSTFSFLLLFNQAATWQEGKDGKSKAGREEYF